MRTVHLGPSMTFGVDRDDALFKKDLIIFTWIF